MKMVVCGPRELWFTYIIYIYTLFFQACNDALAFMVGGFHTSGNFITWLLWYLANNPEVQDRLLEEVEKETNGECGVRLKAYAMEVATSYKT